MIQEKEQFIVNQQCLILVSIIFPMASNLQAQASAIGLKFQAPCFHVPKLTSKF
jgi:hypothetical protein